jgi:hypothetical protein
MFVVERIQLETMTKSSTPACGAEEGDIIKE